MNLESAVSRYLPYIHEIRKRFFFVFAIFFIAWVIGFIYYQPIILFIMRLYELKGVNIAFTSPFQFINLAINAGLLLGLLASLPLAGYQLLSFLKPALHAREHRLLISLLPLSVVLFCGGLIFGMWLMRFIIVVFSQQSANLSITNLWDIDHFLSQIFMTGMLLGLLFQFPLVITILIRLHVVEHLHIAKQRPLAYVLLLVFAVLLPPSDIFSLILMFLPLAILFELTLLLNRRVKKAKQIAAI